MSKHTPGPWLIVERTVYALNEKGYNRFFCAIQDPHTPAEELEANARLIAAAPELLQALGALYAAVDSSVDLTPEVMQAAAAAIKKATGEQP